MTRIYLVGRRRPNPFVVAYRWRYEAALSGAATAGWAELPADATLPTTGLLAAVAAAAMAWGTSRRTLVRMVEHVVVQHRMRTGFLQTGLADRDGRLPWITRTRTRGDDVTLSIWLPAGLSPEDLAAEAPRLASSCGASEVLVTTGSSRDRLRLLVRRPRWGIPGR